VKTPIKSTDPRKKMIVEALKKSTGANKITSVYRISESEFQGDCLNGNRSGYENIGTFIFTVKTCEYCGKSKQDVNSTDDPYICRKYKTIIHNTSYAMIAIKEHWKIFRRMYD
jgi:hypothetical protein